MSAHNDSRPDALQTQSLLFHHVHSYPERAGVVGVGGGVQGSVWVTHIQRSRPLTDALEMKQVMGDQLVVTTYLVPQGVFSPSAELSMPYVCRRAPPPDERAHVRASDHSFKVEEPHRISDSL